MTFRGLGVRKQWVDHGARQEIQQGTQPNQTMSNKSDTPTPRTKRHDREMSLVKVPLAKAWPHWYDFAQKLERELAAAQARIAELEAQQPPNTKVWVVTTGNWGYINSIWADKDAAWEHAKKVCKGSGHINCPSEYELRTQQPPAPKFLERPDAPGWWWMWVIQPGCEDTPYWCLEEVDDPVKHYGIYVRATPPQWTPTSEEGEG
jgi:hypothetical protein